MKHIVPLCYPTQYTTTHTHPVRDGHSVEQAEHGEEGTAVDEARQQDVAHPQAALHLWQQSCTYTKI